jgi:cation transport regulator
MIVPQGGGRDALPDDRRLACARTRSPAAHAQEIFLEAYNSAYEEYGDPHKRWGDTSLEETASRVAWAAVKRKYVKAGDCWVQRD